MNTDRELMQQALEALEGIAYPKGAAVFLTITALRERLAQPEQEPVAKAWNEGYRQGVEDERTSEANIGIAGFGAKVEPARQNPYGAAPPQPEQNEFNPDWDAMAVMVEEQQRMAKRIAELEAQQQEPVAWVECDGDLVWNNREAAIGRNLYTAPQPRQWQRLTDEEMRNLEKKFNAERVRTSDEEYLIIYPGDYWDWQRAIEAKLREKNA